MPPAAAPRPQDSPALAPPPGNRRFPLVDACRGSGALVVVAGHTFPHSIHGVLGNLVSEMGAAVPVFFAVSGFLLLRPYLVARAQGDPEPRARDFVRRRALRILPAYWVALTALTLLLGSAYVIDTFSSRWWLYYGLGQVYSLTHNFHGLGVAWSLSVEASFYACLPLFAALTAWLGRRWGWRRGALVPIAVLLCLGPVIHLLNTLSFDRSAMLMVARITYGLPGEANFFAVGMVLAVASVHAQTTGAPPRALRPLVQRPLLAWGLAALCIVLAGNVAGFMSPLSLPFVGVLGLSTRFVANDLLVAAFAFLVLLPAVFDERRSAVPQRLMSLRPVAFVGVVSYGLYLWHLPLQDWLNDHTPLRDVFGWPLAFAWPGAFAVVLSAGLAAGTLSYYLVELPFLRLKPGWRRQTRHPVAVEPEPAAGVAQ